MNIELRKWSVEDKEVLIKMCNSIDRSFLSDRLPNPYTNASAEWWLTMVKDNEGKKGVFREIVVDGEIVGTISVDEYFYPAKNVEKKTARRQIDSSLDLLSDNELKIIQGTIDGILNSRENKK